MLSSHPVTSWLGLDLCPWGLHPVDLVLDGRAAPRGAPPKSEASDRL